MKISKISQCQGDQGGKVHKGYERWAQVNSAKQTKENRAMSEPLHGVIRYLVTCTSLFSTERSKTKPNLGRQQGNRQQVQIICGSSLKIGNMNVNRIAAGGGCKVKTILFCFAFTSREDQCVHLMSKNLHRNEWTKRPEQGEPTHGGRFWKRQGSGKVRWAIESTFVETSSFTEMGWWG